MSSNEYRGVMDDWQMRLIDARARRMGLDNHSRDDVAQQIAIETAKFKSDPVRSGEALQPNAVLSTIVNRQVRSAARRCARDRERKQQMCQRGGIPTEYESKHEMEVDVRTAVSELSPREQRVCAMLAEGESIASIARELECGWHTVERLIADIRQRFESMGLDGWLGS
ncbi:MAG: hypothetical protein IT430_02745 [Phycisphaerales bacterium]|nr:hypothetical protein [Phycisphaerales bacterium]